MSDIRTLSAVAKQLPPNISVLVRGMHGIGKSELVHQLAKHFGLPLLDRRMSQTTEGDVLGLPKMTEVKHTSPNGDEIVTDITRFCPPEFVDRACREPVMLFLDEINRATNEVQQACFQFALDRCDFTGRKFHPETRVYCCVNTGARYNVSEMDPAFIDRFFVYDLKPTTDDYLEHFENRPAELGGPVNRDLLAFLRERPTRLMPSNAKEAAAKEPSPRSWVRLDQTFRSNKVYDLDMDGKDQALKGRAFTLACGFVGIEAANDLVDYLAKRETRFTAQHVLDGYPENREKIKQIGQDKDITLIDLVVNSALENVWTPEQSANLGRFVGDCPAELRVGFITNLTKTLRNHPNFIPTFKVISGTVIPHIVHAFNPNAKLGGQAPPSSFGGEPDAANCIKSEEEEKRLEAEAAAKAESEAATAGKKKKK